MDNESRKIKIAVVVMVIIMIIIILAPKIYTKIYESTTAPYENSIKKYCKEYNIEVKEITYSISDNNYDATIDIGNAKDILSEKEWIDLCDDLSFTVLHGNKDYRCVKIISSGVEYLDNGLTQEQEELYYNLCDDLYNGNFDHLHIYNGSIPDEYKGVGYIIDNADLFDELVNNEWYSKDEEFNWSYSDSYKFERYKSYGNEVYLELHEKEYSYGELINIYTDAIYISDLAENNGSFYVKSNDHDEYEIHLDEVLNNKISKYYPALSDTPYAWSYYEKY